MMRCCRMLTKSTKVVSLVWCASAPANQRWDRRSSTHRVTCSGMGPSGPSKPIFATVTLAGAVILARLKFGNVLRCEPQPDGLPEPRRLAIGGADMAEQSAAAFQPAQQLEEIICVRQIAGSVQIRWRLPGVIGHSTSSCLCSKRVLVRTKPLMPQWRANSRASKRRQQQRALAGHRRLVDMQRYLGASAETHRPGNRQSSRPPASTRPA